jgi:ubiquinone/menaquinone biosynthesis C-methylase UbiE
MPNKQGTVAKFRAGKEKIRERLLKYTRQAFDMLPRMEKPQILDIGCGSGIPTLELARLSQGQIMGVDIDQSALITFTNRMKEAGLGSRVRAVECSMSELNVPDSTFDIIWAEGSIYAIGFARGLREWGRWLKPGGFMVIHDSQEGIREKLTQIAGCGYDLLGYFTLSTDTWREEYFTPLERLVAEFRTSTTEEMELLQELKQAEEELAMFEEDPERNSSVYFVMHKG